MSTIDHIPSGNLEGAQAQSVPLAVLDAGAGDRLVVPGGNMLLIADFQHQGPDLVLVGPDGATVIVTDYFATSHPPALLTAGGAIMSPELVAKLAGPMAPGQYAQATPIAVEPIGQVKTIDGSVGVTRVDGTQVILNVGDSVFQGDVLETGDDGAVGIILADGTTFSLAESGRMVLDEMIYDPGSQEGELVLNLIQGVFSFVSGQIAKTDPEAMTVQTPMAVIGIRGTGGAIGVNENGEMTAALMEEKGGFTGEMTITNGAGVVILNQPFQATSVVSFNTPPSQIFTMSTQEFGRQFGGAMVHLPNAQDHLPDDFREEIGRVVEQQRAAANEQGEGEVAEGEGEGEGPDGEPGPEGDQLAEGPGPESGPEGPSPEQQAADAALEAALADGATPEEAFEAAQQAAMAAALAQGADPDQVAAAAAEAEAAFQDALASGATADEAMGAALAAVGDPQGPLGPDQQDPLYPDQEGPLDPATQVPNDPTFGSNDPIFGSNDPIFGSNDPIFGSNDPIFGSNNPIFVDPGIYGGPGTDIFGGPGTGIYGGGFDFGSNDPFGDFVGDDPFGDFDPYGFGDPYHGTYDDFGPVDDFGFHPDDDDGGYVLPSPEDVDTIIIGTTGADVIVGASNSSDLIAALEGDDYIYGDTFDQFDPSNPNLQVTNPIFSGGGSVDIISGGAGDDNIWGGGGNDIIDGDVPFTDGEVSVDMRLALGDPTPGNDTIHGGDGNDMIMGGGGNDMIYGDAGADRMDGWDGDDLLFGGSGDDHIFGGAGTDYLYGEAGNDMLNGAFGADTIEGGAGNDTIAAGEDDGSADTIYGGTAAVRDQGVDTVVYADAMNGVAVNLGPADGSSAGTATDNGGTTIGTDTLWAIDNVVGSGFDDVLTGSGDDNRLEGSWGNDIIWGAGGTDVLLGGDGDDVFRIGANGELGVGSVVAGGLGNDTLNVTNTAVNSVNLLQVAMSGVETINLDGGAAGGVNLIVDAADLSSVTSIVGDGANDTLQLNGNINFTAMTFTGIETLALGANQSYSLLLGDGLVGPSATLTVTASGVGGNQVIVDGSGELDGNLNLIGGNGGDDLIGGYGNDRLTGGQGDDNLWGGSGSDTFVFAGGVGPPGTFARVSSLGTDSIGDFNPVYDNLALSNGDFGFGVSGTLADGTNYYETSTALSGSATDFGGTGDAVIIVGAASGQGGVEVWFTDDQSAATLSNSYQITTISGNDTSTISNIDFTLVL